MRNARISGTALLLGLSFVAIRRIWPGHLLGPAAAVWVELGAAVAVLLVSLSSVSLALRTTDSWMLGCLIAALVSCGLTMLLGLTACGLELVDYVFFLFLIPYPLVITLLMLTSVWMSKWTKDTSFLNKFLIPLVFATIMAASFGALSWFIWHEEGEFIANVIYGQKLIARIDYYRKTHGVNPRDINDFIQGDAFRDQPVSYEKCDNARYRLSFSVGLDVSMTYNSATRAWSRNVDLCEAGEVLPQKP